MSVNRDVPHIEDTELNEIEKIVRAAIDQRQAGREIDYTAIEEEHTDLMPELGDRLRRLKAVESAAATAQQDSRTFVSTGGGDVAYEEDLRFLRNALRGYEILDRIEYGGQGVVYRAMQKTTNRTVAIKVLLDGPLAPQRQRARFEREVELSSRLQHPNIVAVYESGLVRGRQYLAMEYVDGLPLDDYVLLNGLSVRETVELFRIVCQAVSAAHQRGVIHRDLKPANILVDSEGQPHILDFGLAKDLMSIEFGDNAPSLSVTGQVLGTRPYLSPEQVCGLDDQVDVRSDIYSLGIAMFEAITGGFPYPVDGDRETLRNDILTREPVRLRKALSPGGGDGFISSSDVSEDLERIVLKALEKDRAHRYQSAAAFSDDLGRYLAGDAVQARAANAFYVLRKTLRRFRVQVAISAVFLGLVVASLIGTTVLWQRAERIAHIAQTGLEVGGIVKLASAARDAGRIDQSMAMLQKAIEIGNQVPEDDPYVQRQLYNSHQLLTHELIETGRVDEADAHSQAATAIVEEFVRRHPEDLEWRRKLGLSHTLRGRVAFTREEWEDALIDFEEAASISESLLNVEPENALLRSNLAYNHNTQAECYLALDRLDDSLQHYTKAHELYQALTESHPDASHYAIQLSRTEAKLGVWHLFKRTPQHTHTAMNWLTAAEDRLRKLSNSKEGRGRQWDIGILLDVIEQNKALALRRISKQEQTLPIG